MKNVFMAVEQPRLGLKDEDEDDVHRHTIGGFYRRVQRGVARLVRELGEENVFTGDPSYQVTGEFFPDDENVKVFPVTDLKSANAAIELIVREGEGSEQMNPTEDDSELAHYYKFAEIFYGRELVRENGTWSYTGKYKKSVSMKQGCEVRVSEAWHPEKE